MCFGYPLRYQRFLLKVQVHKYVYNLARDVILAELFYLQVLLSPKSIDFSETFIQKPVVFSSQKCFDDISTRWNKQTPHRSFTLHQRMISKQWQCNIIQNNSKIWNKYSVRVWIKRHDIYIAYMYISTLLLLSYLPHFRSQSLLFPTCVSKKKNLPPLHHL